MSRIMALIKKDIRFNWKIIIGVLIGVTIFVPLNWADYKIEGVWDLDYKWLWCWFICAAGVLAVNPGLRTEQGASTNVFLAALPFTMKELFLSKIIENVVYTVLVAGILTAGILLFGYPAGGTGFYFLQYDLRQHSLSGGFQQSTVIPSFGAADS